MLPKEHGAYGQLLFPLLTALIVTGIRLPALLLVVAAVACFLAHEPLLVLLGQRGPRARREHLRLATVVLAALGAAAAVAGGLAFARMPAPLRWSLLVPVVFVAPVVAAILAGREKSWPAEIAVSVALPAAAFPVAVSAGATLASAATISLAFSVTFVLATLAVRTIILGVRAGGDPGAVAATQGAAFVLAVGIPLAMAAAALLRLLPWVASAAVLPGVFVSVRLAACPPPPSRLRRVGWSLVGVFTFTSAILIAGLRS